LTVATYVSDLTDISLFESTTGITDFGGGGGAASAGVDYAIEGTNAVDKQVNATERGFLFGAGANFVIFPKDHFYIWVVVGTYGIAATRDLRGVQVCIGDDTSNFVKFHVNGSDTLPFGGMLPYAIRFDNTSLANRRTLVGTPGTTPDSLGCGANITAGAKFANLAADAGRIGNSYRVLNGTGADPEANFAGISTDDLVAQEGIFQVGAGGFNWQGKLRFGSDATPCELLDLNTNLFITDTLDGHALTDFTEMLVAHASSIITLTNVNFVALGTNNRGRLELVKPIIDAQDETSYDDTPTSEGVFSGGTGHNVADIIYMSDGTKVTVDAETANVVTQFTVDSGEGGTVAAGATLTQVFTTGTGASFTLTPDTDNVTTGDPTLTFTGCGFIDFGETVLGLNATLRDCRFVGADQVTANGADLGGTSFEGYEGTANTSSLIWDTSGDPDGELDGCSFDMGVALTHGLELGLNAPTTITLRDTDWSGGYVNTVDNNASAIHVKHTSGTTTINIIGGTGFPGVNSYRTDGAAVVIVLSPFTTTVNVVDDLGADLQNASVYLVAEDGTGDMPFDLSITTIARAGTVATVTTGSAHTMDSGEKVKITGITDKTEDNAGTHVITVTGATTFTYVTTDSGSTSYTGTMVLRGVLIEGLTDVNGDITFTRTWTLVQPCEGQIRKSTTGTKFKTFELEGTVVSNTAATQINARLVLDE